MHYNYYYYDQLLANEKECHSAPPFDDGMRSVTAGKDNVFPMQTQIHAYI